MKRLRWPWVRSSEIDELLNENERLLADWAAEVERADRFDAAHRALQEVLGTAWLHVNWRWITTQFTTGQREMWADAVDAWSARLNEGTDEPGACADRWWRS